MTDQAPIVRRIEVHPKSGVYDPLASSLVADARELAISIDQARSARIYLIQGDLSDGELEQIGRELLADPVTQTWHIGAKGARDGERTIEVHPLPGVMDPAAASTTLAIRELTGRETEVRTGRRYDLSGIDESDARTVAERLLANAVVERIHTEPYLPDAFLAGTAQQAAVTHVPITTQSDDELAKLSRDAHLFLSVEEMRTIAAYFREQGREPTDIELETLAQTWSEHCVHKTLKSTIRYEGDLEQDIITWTDRPGIDVLDDRTVQINNLLKCTVAAATFDLIEDGVDWTLSVFVDNAGVIRFDDEHAVCVKVETHNHPSAIEPYGGAATGVGGVIRDVIGTGLAAKPIASTDVFCVGHPDTTDVPTGCLRPKRILKRVVAGVRDYGNRMGIPTVNGAVWFDDRYVGNPLVFCGSVGVMPAHLVHGDADPGDHIIVLGGRTGRDGIHGATFSSAELTDTHADEFSHAVQIGNPIEEKRCLDAILRARDEHGEPLYSAITDCGAGGFSSAVGEMGEAIGATVHLERAPLKYDGLTYTEIWISEAQERMVLAVPEENIEALRKICREESVELCDLGTFGTDDRSLELKYGDLDVGSMSMEFLHNGLPDTHRDARWTSAASDDSPVSEPAHDVGETLRTLLAHPNIASKHWIIRQYDHEVQGGSVVKPLVGPDQAGPGDAAVVKPVLESSQGLAIACGLATGFGLPEQGGDPYLMTIASIDECVRNLVCVGADPSRIAILDNYCWPGCDEPEQLGSLVRASIGCYDAAVAYRTPFVSGKDSLNNQFTTESGETIRIPPTLLITGVGIVSDESNRMSMDAKPDPSRLVAVGITGDELAGSHAALVDPELAVGPIPRVDLQLGPRVAAAVASLIEDGLVIAVHDCSDGGLLVAAAEMAFAGTSDQRRLGLELDLSDLPGPAEAMFTRCFNESPSRYLLQVHEDDVADVIADLAGLPHAVIGSFNTSGRLTLVDDRLDEDLDDLRDLWRGSLDWTTPAALS